MSSPGVPRKTSGRLGSVVGAAGAEVGGSPRSSPHPPHKKTSNNLGVSFDRRHKDRRASSMQLERSSNGKFLLRGEGGTIKEVEVVSTRDRDGFFDKCCPVMYLCPALLCCLLNFIPGLGTFVASFLNLCFAKNRKETEGKRCYRFWVQILTAFLQVLTFPIIAGIIWSIMYGVTMVQKSKNFVVDDDDTGQNRRLQLA